MALKYYKHNTTGEIIRTMKGPPGNAWSELLIPAETKFMEKTDIANNKSVIKNQKSMLRERARNHARDVDGDDLIQINKANSVAVSQNFLNEKGEKRRKID